MRIIDCKECKSEQLKANDGKWGNDRKEGVREGKEGIREGKEGIEEGK
jgi:hypothetical protein